MSDTLSGTTHPDDNHDHPWWGLPCTVTPCFGARLVQEGNRLHLVQALGLVDIRVPDHLIVGGSQVFSFAEHGLL
ncbi:antitoxin YeeU [Escherichia coli BIDMC 65]|nr:antitoxin YeeU [Escherichia coli BIDMC 65]